MRGPSAQHHHRASPSHPIRSHPHHQKTMKYLPTRQVVCFTGRVSPYYTDHLPRTDLGWRRAPFCSAMCKNHFSCGFRTSRTSIHPSPPLVIVVNESLCQPLSLIIHIMDSTCTAVHFGMRQRSALHHAPQNKLTAIDEPFFLSKSLTTTTTIESRSILEPGRGTGPGDPARRRKGINWQTRARFRVVDELAPCRYNS